MSKPWTIKYAPKTTKEVCGQNSALVQLKTFILSFKNAKKKAVFLYGPAGVGKTSTVYAIASELGHEIMELNASDFRDEDSVKSIVGSASKQMSLFGNSKIILVDEVDGLHGMEDRGGVAALKEVIQESSFPIVLIANNPWDHKFSSLRSACIMIEFPSLSYQSVYTILKIICDREGISYEDDALRKLGMNSVGDARGAINDLQSLLVDGKVSAARMVAGHERERQETVLSALTKIFKGTDPIAALRALENVDEDQDKMVLWLDENLPKEYQKPEELARAYDALSRADVFKGRIRRWQHWRYMAYINDLLTAGISLAKDQKYSTYTAYKPTSRILKIWMANQKYAKRKAIAKKIAEATHTSTKEALQATLPYIKPIFQKNEAMAKQLIDEFKLNEEEVQWLKS